MAITATDLQDMVTHWLGCPVNGYLGSSYGSDISGLLQQPQASTAADEFINKLNDDVPLTALRPDIVDVVARRRGVDKLDIGIDVMGTFILLDAGERDGLS